VSWNRVDRSAAGGAGGQRLIVGRARATGQPGRAGSTLAPHAELGFAGSREVPRWSRSGHQPHNRRRLDTMWRLTLGRHQGVTLRPAGLSSADAQELAGSSNYDHKFHLGTRPSSHRPWSGPGHVTRGILTMRAMLASGSRAIHDT
jgi:hypothetical protein